MVESGIDGCWISIADKKDILVCLIN